MVSIKTGCKCVCERGAQAGSCVLRVRQKNKHRPSDQRAVAEVQHTELLASLQALCVVFLTAVLSPRAHSFTTCSPWPAHEVGSDGGDQSNTSNMLKTLGRQTYSLVEGQQNKGGYRGELSEDRLAATAEQTNAR